MTPFDPLPMTPLRVHAPDGTSAPYSPDCFAGALARMGVGTAEAVALADEVELQLLRRNEASIPLEVLDELRSRIGHSGSARVAVSHVLAELLDRPEPEREPGSRGQSPLASGTHAIPRLALRGVIDRVQQNDPRLGRLAAIALDAAEIEVDDAMARAAPALEEWVRNSGLLDGDEQARFGELLDQIALPARVPPTWIREAAHHIDELVGRGRLSPDALSGSFVRALYDTASEALTREEPGVHERPFGREGGAATKWVMAAYTGREGTDLGNRDPATALALVPKKQRVYAFETTYAEQGRVRLGGSAKVESTPSIISHNWRGDDDDQRFESGYRKEIQPGIDLSRYTITFVTSPRDDLVDEVGALFGVERRLAEFRSRIRRQIRSEHEIFDAYLTAYVDNAARVVNDLVELSRRVDPFTGLRLSAEVSAFPRVVVLHTTIMLEGRPPLSVVAIATTGPGSDDYQIHTLSRETAPGSGAYEQIIVAGNVASLGTQAWRGSGNNEHGASMSFDDLMLDPAGRGVRVWRPNQDGLQCVIVLDNSHLPEQIRGPVAGRLAVSLSVETAAWDIY